MSASPKPPKVTYITVPLDQLIALRRNPQYLSEKQNEALKKSIQRDGFLAPIVIRKKKALYEILSGNHRVIASREAGLTKVPAVLIHPCDDARAARIAVNMNTVHGYPTPELLAPFLSDMDGEALRDIFMDDALLAGLLDFDDTLKSRLDELELPESLSRASPTETGLNCVCSCGHRHHAVVPKPSRLSKPKATNTKESSKS